MTDELARDLVAEAQAGAPNEVCGFVINNWDWISIPNCHPEPDRHFNMDEQAMLDVLLRNAHNVLGIYHSHPSGRKAPSPDDVGLMRNYAVHGFRFWIVTYNNVYEWRIQDDEPRPVRRDGTTGSTDMAHPVLTTPAPV